MAQTYLQLDAAKPAGPAKSDKATTLSPQPKPWHLDQLEAELASEISMRERVFAKKVGEGTMTAHTKAFKIRQMQCLLGLVKALQGAASLNVKLPGGVFATLPGEHLESWLADPETYAARSGLDTLPARAAAMLAQDVDGRIKPDHDGVGVA